MQSPVRAANVSPLAAASHSAAPGEDRRPAGRADASRAVRIPGRPAPLPGEPDHRRLSRPAGEVCALQRPLPAHRRPRWHS